MPLTIVVDVNESRSGLPKLLAKTWSDVHVRRLDVGDVAIGDRVRIERKTAEDYVASLADGRLFRQAAKLAFSVPRPAFIIEGDGSYIAERVTSGSLRGARLALAFGFRLPILVTVDLEDTASCIRHIAAQEARRESRRRANARGAEGSSERAKAEPPLPLPPDAMRILLDLPGVGPYRAQSIAARVGSLGDLCQLGVRDLMRVPGIGPDTAARIVDVLRTGGARNVRDEGAQN